MAHSPEKKAEVVADLLRGIGIREAAKKHGIPSPTVSLWAKTVQTFTPGTGVQKTDILPVDEDALIRARVERFNSALEGFLMQGLEMSRMHAELLTDVDFLRSIDPQKLESLLDAVSRHWLALLSRISQPVQ